MIIPETIDGYTVTGLGDYAFGALNNMTSVTIPHTVVEMEANPFALKDKLSSLIVLPGNKVYTVDNGVLVDLVNQRVVCCLQNRPQATYSIP